MKLLRGADGLSSIGKAWTVLRSYASSLIESTRVAADSKKKVSKKKITPLSIPAGRGTESLKQVLIFFLGIVFCMTFLGIVWLYQAVSDLPNPHLIGSVNYSVSTQIFDRDGTLIYEIAGDQNRTPVSLKVVPEHLVEATIAVEDKDFLRHNGISLFGGIFRAIKDSLFTGHLQGGSTITQQLIKTSLLSSERSVTRKVKEAVIALWAERVYSKDTILEMYLNQVPYGGSSYGIEQAAQRYFGKSVRDITLSEAALLAGLPKAPSVYSPFTDEQAAIHRRNYVLQEMVQQGYINEAEADAAQKEELHFNDNAGTYLKAPHFVFYVKQLLEDKYGTRMTEEGGLRVYTTIDLTLQNELENILQEELQKLENLKVTNGAIIVLDPYTGEVLAMVGSRDYYSKPYGAYNVTTGIRQPGSSIKPLVYAYAFEHGQRPWNIVDDSPVTFANGSQVYSPRNYDGQFHGRVSIRTALGNSYNIPSVRTLYEYSLKDFLRFGKDMGITTWNDPSRYGLSIALGAGEVKLIELASAYGVFANRGMKIEARPILRIEDYRGKLLLKDTFKPERVISEQTAFWISSILSDNIARSSAFGSASLLKTDYLSAVKTGTTNAKRDNLTIGFTDTFLTAVWVGNNDNTPMDQQLTSGITGAAPIWRRVMDKLESEYRYKYPQTPHSPFIAPSGFTKRFCGSSGEYVGEHETVPCNPIRREPSVNPDAQNNEESQGGQNN
ncbi:MAG: Penicillin-binding protein 2D [Microgenomates bacterium OLB22]|nr:MAG: Penicillin-binding protein 2D [Microgenomates bacterium OLB22]